MSAADFKLANPWKAQEKSKPVTTASEEKKGEKEVTATNISTFISVVSDLLSFFESTQNSIEKSNARIVEKYPKFLSKLALFKLQMDDSMFRETFMVQIMIFT